MESDIAGPLLLQLVLILLNAFFAMSEIAVISLNDNKIRQQANAGDKKSKRIMRLIDAPSSFMATIQVGITLAGFLASAFAADSFSGQISQWLVSLGVAINPKVLDTIAVVGITLILSLFMLIFGELVPKRIAMQRSEPIARFVAGPISALARITKPVVWFLSTCTNLLLRLFGFNPNADEEEVTEEEIRMMVDIGEEKGIIDAEEQRMIENVFEFDKKQVYEAMQHRVDVVAVSLEDSDEEIFNMFDTSGYSRLPVYEEDIDHVIGVLHARDFLMNRMRGNPKALRDILRPCLFVPETLRVDLLFNQMQQQHIHIAIAFDEHGGMSGLITLEDALEEIVGNIFDEFDDLEAADIQSIDENHWRIKGSAPLEEVNECLGLDIQTEDYDTLAGFIFDQLQVIPDDGTNPQFQYDGFSITIAEITERRIEWVDIERVAHLADVKEAVGAGRS